MSSPEFLSQVRPAEVLREAILRHVRYTLVRPTSELKPADYLPPVSLAIRDREIAIDRVCARCACEYEWGIDARVFGRAAGSTNRSSRRSSRKAVKKNAGRNQTAY